MAITADDLKIYKAVTNSDEATNGGRMSDTEIVSNVLENLLPNVTEAERVAGLTRYRKFYSKNESDESDGSRNGLGLVNHRVCVGRQSPGDDWLRLHDSTAVTDVQSDATNYTDWVGCGKIYAGVAVDQTSIQLQFDGPVGGPYDGVYAGNTVRLAQYAYSDSLGIYQVSKEEFVTVATGGVSWGGSIATLTLTAPLTKAWSAYDEGTDVYTFGSACVECGTIKATKELVSQPRTFDITNVWVYNKGTVEDTFTITFLTATTYSVSGVVTGVLTNGSTGSAYLPPNGDSFYFRLPTDVWGIATWQIGDVIVFKTHQAADGVWCKEIVPADADSIANNNPHINRSGESA